MGSLATAAALPTQVYPGSLNIPSPTPHRSKVLVEVLLERDRAEHHCFINDNLYHNHLSHHVLTAFDMGAPDSLLQEIYDDESKEQLPINIRTKRINALSIADVTELNWTEIVGQPGAYRSYLHFFTQEISNVGPARTLHKYIFSREANVEGVSMLSRYLGGALHPMLQTGYGAEFGSRALLAQGLAQSACTPIFASAKLFQTITNDSARSNATLTALQILRRFYDSDTLAPPLPYSPKASFSQRFKDTFTEERITEIGDLVTLWGGTCEQKTEDVTWISTLLVTACGKPNRKPRSDFFFMHILNSTIFLPRLVALLDENDRQILLNALFATTLLLVLIRRRPRIDPALAMTFTNMPKPPGFVQQASKDALAPYAKNPWFDILADVIHAPDCHTKKCIRALYHASLRYGLTERGRVRGAFTVGDEETHAGIATLDGTLFVRTAGIVMNMLGWVTHGQNGGGWYQTALGWEAEWQNDN